MKKSTRKSIIITLLGILLISGYTMAQERVSFEAEDGLKVTADLYQIEEDSPYIVLAHLSEHSRGEYKDTAIKLNALGFNCLAVDTRTGKEALGVINETAKKAKKLNLPTDFLSSERDIQAVIDYAYQKSDGRAVLLLGSSFSASLALKIGASNPKVRAVMAFSPGEHFGGKLNLKSTIGAFSKPLFVTSSRKEAPEVTDLISDMESHDKIQFIPYQEGMHGSISLWDYNPNHEEYWTALTQFLTPFTSTIKEETLKPKAMKLNAGIITEKIKETKKFYTEILNFGITFENEFYLLLHTPGKEAQLSFLLPHHPTQKPIFQKPFGEQGMYLTIEVDDVDKLYSELKRKGVAMEIEIRDEPWGDRHFTIVDPNGIGIDIVTYTTPEEQ